MERAEALINSGKYKQRPKNQNDPPPGAAVFIKGKSSHKTEKSVAKEVPFLDTAVIAEEERYDGFYAVCKNLEDMEGS